MAIQITTPISDLVAGGDDGATLVGDPAVDAKRWFNFATVKNPVYAANGDWIGIGGMDILIDTIGKSLLAPIKYRDFGQSFLNDRRRQASVFPGFPSVSRRAPANQVDTQFKDTSGFFGIKTTDAKGARVC